MQLLLRVARRPYVEDRLLPVDQPEVDPNRRRPPSADALTGGDPIAFPDVCIELHVSEVVSESAGLNADLGLTPAPENELYPAIG